MPLPMSQLVQRASVRVLKMEKEELKPVELLRNSSDPLRQKKLVRVRRSSLKLRPETNKSHFSTLQLKPIPTRNSNSTLCSEKDLAMTSSCQANTSLPGSPKRKK